MAPTRPPYVPDDSGISAASLAFLHSAAGASLREECRSWTLARQAHVSTIASLRRRFSPEIVHTAVTLAQLQPKAREKFPVFRDRFIYALPEALEQATDSAVAAHKATRVAQASPKDSRMIDLCCGIGGDALGLAQHFPTLAVDLSESRLACLHYNHEMAPTVYPLETQQADVVAWIIAKQPADPNTLFHIDPARRSAGRRSPAFEDLIPGPYFLRRLIGQFRGGAIKLSPAVDFDTLPPGHLELISRDKSVVQAVLWVGSLADQFPENTRTATTITGGRGATPFSYTGTPGPALETVSPMPNEPATAAPPRFLFEVDPAFTRAQLAAPLARSLELHPLTGDAGYVIGPDPVLLHPALTPFEILTTIPYSENRVLHALQQWPVTGTQAQPLEVKTRGKIPGVDTDRLQRVLSAANRGRYTVLIYRHENRIVATLAKRLPVP
jgi:hypothetical protein